MKRRLFPMTKSGSTLTPTMDGSLAGYAGDSVIATTVPFGSRLGSRVEGSMRRSVPFTSAQCVFAITVMWNYTMLASL